MVQQRAQRLALARLRRQGRQFPCGLREQVLERLLQGGLRRVERRVLPFENGVVMRQARLVQAIDQRNPLDPSLTPRRQPLLAGGAVDIIAALMRPT